MFKPAAMLMVLTAVALGGCELAALVAGKGTENARYTLPKDKRLLVFVDVRPNVAAPPGFSTMLGEKIGSHLYRNLAAQRFVMQDRLVELQRDPVAFSKMGVADVARHCDAEVVVVVDVWDFTQGRSTDREETEAMVQALVKVVDRDGQRLWPAGENPGATVEARADPALAADRDTEAMVSQLTDLLAVRAGRLFHKYDLENRQMTR